VIKIKVEGLRELDAALGQLPKATGRAVLARVAKKALAICRDAAKRKAPKDTQLLANSIAISREKDFGYIERVKASFAAGGTARGIKRTKQNGVAFALGPVARFVRNRKSGRPAGLYGYALYQEFGTSQQRAQPYMRPAFDSTKDEMLASVAEQLGPEIEKTAARIAKRRAKRG
jgi:HK97 gp10 family phage protein